MVCYKNVSEYRFQYADLRKSGLGKYLLIPIFTVLFWLGEWFSFLGEWFSMEDFKI